MIELEAGRELDALVAERVFGKVIQSREWPCGTDPFTGCYMAAGSLQEGLLEETAMYTERDVVYRTIKTALGWGVALVPRYSTDIAAAWLIIEHLRDLWTEATDGVRGSDAFDTPFDDQTFFECLHRHADRRWPWAFLYVTPDAICRAALDAVAYRATIRGASEGGAP